MAVTVSTQTLTQPLGLLRLLQLLSTCVAFSCVAHVGAWMGPMGNWSMFTWCFCFVVTFIILCVEVCGCQARFPLSWQNFPITYALYAALFCLSSSIIYPTTYVQFMSEGSTRNHAIAACTFSCIAFLAYATEVSWTRGKSTGYMATIPGLLKVLETFVACIIFAFLSNAGLYQRHEALEWCVAVYAICFILAAVTILLNLGDCTNVLPIAFPTFLTVVAVLSFLMYATAMIIWPLYQFNENYGGQSRRLKDSYCAYRHPHSVCNWDRRLAVALLTGVNLLAYLTDLVHSTRVLVIK
ncbi:myeloid-associated differentiation marker [Dipodomys spectabilis]|uniref:myeloid-associated differentiation marker n=1 Tax=Dipodomys spectabilis TaxID=105255 RepID=UPI001C53A21D|nr:myeloid-associated differentiation marker [Dipodomys spectabilis]XP_042539260.1 myeloid-associated differentiation marker [Dipodomys spectabilis]XP_042539261.1 myeloid-associated differentiation marker [Dipodomys spectabilis]XP_042539262.1 myeloid-associated differentiation marker [Dipodomys spectabilis]